MRRDMKSAGPSRTIEVTVISAEGLVMNKRAPAKNSVSVTVKSGPFESGSTGVDPEGRGCPSWNERLEMDLPADSPYLAVEARSGSRLVGAASIPVTDFAAGHLPEGFLSFLSYRLRDASGAKNGILNISVRVKPKPKPKPKPATCSAASAGLVMGIPVSYTY